MTTAERRKHLRHPLPTSVQVYHPASRRDYPGRSVDVSEGGMKMYVPATTPVQPGQPIRLTVGAVSRPEFAGLSEKPVDATVIRVDRDALIRTGHLAMAVRFVDAE